MELEFVFVGDEEEGIRMWDNAATRMYQYALRQGLFTPVHQ
jgi:hypothetical protein